MPVQFKEAIVILGKEPIPGMVKTRLAKDIGDHKAAQIQVQLLMHMLEVLEDIKCPVILQLKGDTEGDFARTCRQKGVLVEEQVEGSLTEKIFWASRQARRTLVLGMDMPLLNIKELRLALQRTDIVLGPAEDGGYWLIGGEDIPMDILDGIPWSTDEVWKKTIAKCKDLGIQYHVLSRQQDIDTLSDVHSLLSNPLCPPQLRTHIQSILNNPSS